MWGGFEGRKFPRVKSGCRISVERDSGAKPIIVQTENIGIGGICVILAEPLPKLAKVKVNLDLSDGDQPLSCDGRVVWTVTSRTFGSDKITHDTGVEFLNLSEQSKSRLKRVVSTGSSV